MLAMSGCRGRSAVLYGSISIAGIPARLGPMRYCLVRFRWPAAVSGWRHRVRYMSNTRAFRDRSQCDVDITGFSGLD